ncbi:hypothetical protein HOD75_00670 [archaeon]|jgi:hypothetical protein|nr:hypothetical protein [archaeon]MBT4241389.1 hypothetical protein [archaeon]MBT4418210.1 hypothetical protein [archaeon]
MNYALTIMEPVYIVPLTFGENQIVGSKRYRLFRNFVLDKAIEEHKYFLSQDCNQDVGIGIAEERFKDEFFPGWDNAYLLSRLKINTNFKGRIISEKCINLTEFLKDQVNDLRDLKSRYIDFEKSKGRDKTPEALGLEFEKRYFYGFAAGYRAGYCGFSCRQKLNCKIGRHYSFSNLREFPR